MAFGLAQLIGIGFGLGSVSAVGSATAAILDRRAGRRVRLVLALLPHFGRWDRPTLAVGDEDPILAAMGLPPLALDTNPANRP